MSGLTLDGSHVAAGCLSVTATMGATLDSSSAIFGFNVTGVALEGGHEFMMEETWIAAYFWNSPGKVRLSGAAWFIWAAVRVPEGPSRGSVCRMVMIAHVN